jgi:glycosyltransferase involved in cell wall biosynthesis
MLKACMKLVRGAVHGNSQSSAKVPQRVVALRNQTVTPNLQESRFKLGRWRILSISQRSRYTSASMTTRIRYNFIAHEAGVGHLAGKHFSSGGAGFCVAEQTLAINAYLSRRGLDGGSVSVLCPAPTTEAILARDAPVVLFDALNSSLDESIEILGSRSGLERFDALIPENQVITAHHVPAGIIASRLGRPFMFFMHSLWPDVLRMLKTGPSGLRSAYCQEIADNARSIFVATQLEKELLLRTSLNSGESGGLEERVHVLPIGVNPHLFHIARSDSIEKLREQWRNRLLPDSTPDDLVFYTVGRFVSYKNQLNVLQAFIAVAENLPGTRLLMLGPATDTAYMEELRQTLEMAPCAVQARVVIRGSESIEAAHLAGDVLVHAAAFESWGRVVDEACICGNATIVNAFPTIAERVGYRCNPAFAANSPDSDDTGIQVQFTYSPTGDVQQSRSLLVDGAQPASIATALHEAARNSDWRQECSDYNRNRVKTYQWEEVVPTLVSHWNSVEAEITGVPPFFQ